MANPIRPCRSRRRLALQAIAPWALALCAAVPATSRAALPAVVEARAGLDLATAAARSWSPDAMLAYLENDEDVTTAGASARWGYLFVSPTARTARMYSVRDQHIVVAADLDMTLEAPPVSTDWIDSGAAIAAAEHEAGHAFERTPGARLTTMLLMRGAFDDADPDRTTWMLVYTAPNAPSLFVVVDAAAGKVRRTWRG